VEAFFHRDLDDMFLCSKMEKFPPGPLIPPTPATGIDAKPTLVSDKTVTPQDHPLELSSSSHDLCKLVQAMVMTMVRFTRCLYAMIASQRFEPPKVFAPFIPQEDHPDYQAYVLGMKLVRAPHCPFSFLATCSRALSPPLGLRI
jgi:hypothetical protein